MNAKNKNIEDIYPLSPMQQGILFHSISAFDLYVQQEGFELKGNLNVSAFKQAWQSAIARHAILRTAFVWENVAQPIQIVGKEVKFPFASYDWRDIPVEQQQQQLEDFLESDRAAPRSQRDRKQELKLSQAPLMRLSLIRVDENTHYFIWIHHHLILDGWSLSLLMQEVFTSYEKYQSALQYAPIESPRPYRDYINWLQQQNKAEAQQFWQKYLQGFSASTPLGIDCQVSDETENYGEETIQISASLKTQLQALANQEKITFNTLLQGVWALLLSYYSGESDVVFGSTSSGRPPNLVGSESTLGVFINTLPVRVQVKSEQLLIPWLKELQTQQVELIQYDYTPLREIQNWSEIAKGLPLFESIFISQDYSFGSTLEEDIQDLQIRNISPARGETNYPLTILVEAKLQLNISLAYDLQRFTAEAIALLLQHFQNLLLEISQNPHRQIQDLPILTPAEKHQLLVEWNDTEVEYPTDKCIHSLFEERVEQTPNAVAVVFEDATLTYQELNDRANQLARYLQTKISNFQTVSTEILIGICLDRSLEMLVGMLGILKAGYSYVPIDPHYPTSRIEYILSDAEISLLLTQSHLTSQLPPVETICLDTDWKIITKENTNNLNLNLDSSNLAYSIYTSGSTGKPKGVTIQHDSLVNFVCGAINKYQITDKDRVLQFASISFDVAVEEIYPSLVTGGTVVLNNSDAIDRAAIFLAKIQQLQITVLDLPTAYWQQLVTEIVVEKLNIPESIRLVIIGGEQAHLKYVKQWQEYIGNTPQLINAYGPTEGTVETTIYPLSNELRDKLPIGKPLPNVRVYILNDRLQPVPIGVAGELYIGGAGVARGYLNRPELTKEKFIRDPFVGANGRSPLLYKTGDRVRYLNNGNLEFIGRIDNQVKVRGFRVELGEIEVILNQDPFVKEAVVIAREQTDNSKAIAAYLIPTQELGDRSISELRQKLESKLPKYAIPSSFTILAGFPLTSSGKIDRLALPTPSPITDETIYSEPITTIEKQLVSIWQEVLSIDKIGIHDNFFELGGDSIISLQVISKSHQAEIYLTPKQLFQYPTIAQLATVADSKNTSTAEQGLVTGTFPLIPIQSWFFEENFANPHHYNQAVMLNVPSDIDGVTLQKAIAKLISHHDLLRTKFEQVESQWQPYIVAESNLEYFTQLDFSEISEDRVKSTIEETAEDIQTSLNLSTGQIFRAVLLNLGSNSSNRLLLVIHHLVVDGVSWRILLEDLQNIYNYLKNNQLPQLLAKTTSFSQWTEQLVSYASSGKLHSELDYWLTTLKQPVTSLPLDYPKGENSEASIESISVALNSEETQTLLQEIPATYQTQINDVLLTALVQTFTQWMGGKTLLFDLEGHGREALFEDVDLSRTVGWFTSIFPVLLNLEGIENLGEALKTIKEQLRAIPNRGIGYGILRYLSQETAIIESLSSLPQAEISFNYLGQFEDKTTESSGFTLATESSGTEQSHLNHRSHVLEIDGMIIENCLQLNWTYSQNLHQKSTIESLAKSYLANLRSLIFHCQSPDAGGFTPSDFAEFKQSKWNNDDLAAITAAIKGGV